jgi:hypothetical protein
MTQFNISWPWNPDEDKYARGSYEIRLGSLHIIFHPGDTGLRFNKRHVVFTRENRPSELQPQPTWQLRAKKRPDRRPIVISFPYQEGQIEKVSYIIEGNVFTLIVTTAQSGATLSRGDIEFSREIPKEPNNAKGLHKFHTIQ